MDINKKIEEIRRKPEHIRMRYVWVAVAITMLFVFIIWIFSLQETFKSSQPEESSVSDLKEKFQSQKQEMPSLDDFMKQGDKLTEENISNQNNSPAEDNSNLNQEGVDKVQEQEKSNDADGSGISNSSADNTDRDE
jgi:Tfp pilus assembly protein PilO